MASLLSLKHGVPWIKFVLGDTTALGRSSDCEIQLLDPQLSRHHARILRKGDEHWLEDLGSRNGTLVGGSKLDGPVRLGDGDEIRLGDHVFIYNPSIDVMHERRGDKTVLVVGAEIDEPEVTTLERSDAAQRVDRDALLAIHELTCELVAELDIGLLLGKLLDRLSAHFGADRGVILLREPQTDRWRPLAVKTDRPGIAISRTLLDRATAERRALLFHDALGEVSFVGARSIVEHQLRSVMLVPLVAEDDVIGLIQLDHTDRDSFDQGSLGELELLSRAAAPAIRNARRFEREQRKSATLASREVARTTFVGDDPKIAELLAVTEKAAASDTRVLITGESGTGKELIARMIHERSRRSDGPWIPVNLAAVPDTLIESELFGHEKGAFTGANRRKRGCFELADGGTLFLDEVAELAPSMQVKLLRAIQEGTFFKLGGERPVEVDVRVVAATNRDLAKMVDDGGFRQDLFYRLNVIGLEIPPLRERPGDVDGLSRFFLKRFAGQLGKPVPLLAPDAAELLAAYPWPGNVRELQNAIERLMVLHGGPEIRAVDLPSEIRAPDARVVPGSKRTLQEVLAATEREMIAAALIETGGNKSAACRLLGISRPTLDKKIVDYRIEY
ncbi:MAG: sigma 54-interacting transcriptional regulator [Deltaproteobacteria bacterium]|nr:sigma 54-interacting transcriptional regulator [Deltaproteobacteria bacterium]